MKSLISHSLPFLLKQLIPASTQTDFNYAPLKPSQDFAISSKLRSGLNFMLAECIFKIYTRPT